MKLTGRIAVYLILLLVLNDFGPAHFKRLGRHNLKTLKPKTESGGQKRSAIGRFGSFIAKNLPNLAKASKFFELATTIATVIGTFISIVTQCCSDPKYSKTCDYTKEAEEIQAELETKKEQIRNIILETKNLEGMIEMAQIEFNFTVLEMHKIGQASGRLLTSLNTSITLELELLDKRLERLVAEKAAINETVQYVKIEKEYFNVLDGVLGIAVPVFTSIIPSIPKLQKWIKGRMGRYKVYELDHTLDAKTIEPPKIGDKKYQAGNSWFGKQASKIVYKVDKINYKLQTKFQKAYEIAANFKQGIDIAISFIQSAYNIYSLYETLTKCKEAFKKAETAVKEMRNAKEKMEQVYKEVTEAKKNMTLARDQLHEQLISEVFLNDLIDLKETLQKLTEDGTDDDFKGIIESIDRYVNDIKTNDPTFVETVKIISELYQGLGQLSTYFDCYTAKASVIRNVIEECKRGEGSLDQLKEKAFILYEDRSDLCQKKIGIAPFSNQQLQGVIDERSQKSNFSQNCEANNQFERVRVCSKYCKGDKKEKLGHPTPLVDEFLKYCIPCKIEGYLKNLACHYRKEGKTAQETFNTWFANLSDRGYTIQQITELDCPT